MSFLRLLWLLVRLCAASALLYVSITLTAYQSLAALPLIAISTAFLFVTVHTLALTLAERPHEKQPPRRLF